MRMLMLCVVVGLLGSSDLSDNDRQIIEIILIGYYLVFNLIIQWF